MTAGRVQDRVAYCSGCGRPAHEIGATLDGHPLVECRRTTETGAQAGHGRVVGSYDFAEIRRWMDAARSARVTPRHHLHVESGRVNAWCEVCRVEPPPRRERLHPYAALTTRLRAASHLEFSHGHHELHGRTAGYTFEQLTAMHQQDHEEAIARSLPKRRNDPTARYAGHD